MAFSVSVPLNDPVAEARIAAAYASDPGASISGTYETAAAAINASTAFPNVRFLVVGNKHDCAAPIADYAPSPAVPALPLAHPWQKPSPASIGGGKDVMGGNPAGAMSATCYYFGLELWQTQGVPIGLIHSSYGGSAVEDWIDAETLGDGTSGPCPGPIVQSMGLPSQQWNGQMRPLVNTTIKGAIWYQGESNCGQDELYACRFEQMMGLWRRAWSEGTGGATDPAFPIGLVQIGPMVNRPPSAWNLTFAIRNGQTADFGYAPNARWPHTFMATAFDLANPPNTNCVSGCIHIFNKQAVAHRLAVAARKTIYNDSAVQAFSGPRPTGVTAATRANALVVTYDAVGTEGRGIVLRSQYGFEVSTDEGLSWQRGNATVSTKDTVLVTLPSAVTAADVTQVRYAFDDMPSLFYGTQPAVYNAEGLPATPALLHVGARRMAVAVDESL